MAIESHPTNEEREFTAPGVEITMLAGTDETDGAWSLFDYGAAAGFQGPPPHWHEELIEGFYVLEGELAVSIDGQDRLAGEGEYVLIPTYTVHSFAVTEDGPGRFLLQVSPGGFEGYFKELAQLMSGADSWPPEDMEPVQELMSRYDTHTPPVESVQ